MATRKTELKCLYLLNIVATPLTKNILQYKPKRVKKRILILYIRTVKKEQVREWYPPLKLGTRKI